MFCAYSLFFIKIIFFQLSLYGNKKKQKPSFSYIFILYRKPFLISQSQKPQSQKHLTVHTTCVIMNIEQKAQLPIIYAAKHTPQNKNILKNLQRDSERIYFLFRVFLYKKKRPANASLFKCLQ